MAIETCKDGKAVFELAVASASLSFEKTLLCDDLNSGRFTLSHYHELLRMIFHQTFHGPYTFALAAAHCPPNFPEVRSYLISHAEEEKTHWTWVLNDLKNTNGGTLD